MSEILEHKHAKCALIVAIVVVLFLIYMNRQSQPSDCGCGSMATMVAPPIIPKNSNSFDEGYYSPSLRAMSKEGLYIPKERLTYANPKENFVPSSKQSMQMQMKMMSGAPVGKTRMNLAPSDPQSPFINYTQ